MLAGVPTGVCWPVKLSSPWVLSRLKPVMASLRWLQEERKLPLESMPKLRGYARLRQYVIPSVGRSDGFVGHPENGPNSRSKVRLPPFLARGGHPRRRRQAAGPAPKSQETAVFS